MNMQFTSDCPLLHFYGRCCSLSELEFIRRISLLTDHPLPGCRQRLYRRDHLVLLPEEVDEAATTLTFRIIQGEIIDVIHYVLKPEVRWASLGEKVLGVVGKRQRDDFLGLELGASQDLWNERMKACAGSVTVKNS